MATLYDHVPHNNAAAAGGPPALTPTNGYTRKTSLTGTNILGQFTMKDLKQKVLSRWFTERDETIETGSTKLPGSATPQCLATVCGIQPNSADAIAAGGPPHIDYKPDINRPHICYICGLIIDSLDAKEKDAPFGSQCEHIIPVISLSFLCGLSNGIWESGVDEIFELINPPGPGCTPAIANANRDDYKVFRNTLFNVGNGVAAGEGGGPPGIVYKWAHPACNEIKNAYPFLDLVFSAGGFTSNGPLYKNIENCLATLIYEGRNNKATKRSKPRRWADRCRQYCEILNQVVNLAALPPVHEYAPNGTPIYQLVTAVGENIQYIQVHFTGPGVEPIAAGYGNMFIPLSIYNLARRGPFDEATNIRKAWEQVVRFRQTCLALDESMSVAPGHGVPAPPGGDYTKLPGNLKNQWIYSRRNNILDNSINPLHTILANISNADRLKYNQISFELTKHCMLKRINAVCAPAAMVGWLLNFKVNLALNTVMTAVTSNFICGLNQIQTQGGGGKTKNFNKFYSRKYQRLKLTNSQKGGGRDDNVICGMERGKDRESMRSFQDNQLEEQFKAAQSELVAAKVEELVAAKVKEASADDTSENVSQEEVTRQMTRQFFLEFLKNPSILKATPSAAEYPLSLYIELHTRAQSLEVPKEILDLTFKITGADADTLTQEDFNIYIYDLLLSSRDIFMDVYCQLFDIQLDKENSKQLLQHITGSSEDTYMDHWESLAVEPLNNLPNTQNYWLQEPSQSSLYKKDLMDFLQYLDNLNILYMSEDAASSNFDEAADWLSLAPADGLGWEYRLKFWYAETEMEVLAVSNPDDRVTSVGNGYKVLNDSLYATILRALQDSGGDLMNYGKYAKKYLSEESLYNELILGFALDKGIFLEKLRVQIDKMVDSEVQIHQEFRMRTNELRRMRSVVGKPTLSRQGSIVSRKSGFEPVSLTKEGQEAISKWKKKRMASRYAPITGGGGTVNQINHLKKSIIKKKRKTNKKSKKKIIKKSPKYSKRKSIKKKSFKKSSKRNTLRKSKRNTLKKSKRKSKR